MRAILHQPGDRREARALHRVGEAAEELAGDADPSAESEHVAREVGGAGLRRRATGDHDARGELLDQPRGLDVAQHHLEDLLRALMDDVRQQRARDLAIALRPGARELDLLVVRHERLERRAVLLLESLGVGLRDADAVDDVAGDVHAAVPDGAQVADLPFVEDGDVGGACAKLDQRDAEFLLVVGEYGQGAGEGFEHELAHAIACALDCLAQVHRR